MTRQQTQNTPELPRDLQIQLIEAFERGDSGFAVTCMGRHPDLSDAISSFMLALVAVSGPGAPEDDAELDAVVTRGTRKGLERFFAAQAAALVPAVTTLSEAMRAASVSKIRLARQLHLGVDVVDLLVSGRINLATVPRRLFERVGATLGASLDQARRWAEAAQSGPQASPALLRGKAAPPDASDATPALSFIQVVQGSGNMSDADKADWLGGDA